MSISTIVELTLILEKAIFCRMVQDMIFVKTPTFEGRMRWTWILEFLPLLLVFYYLQMQ